MSEFLRRMASLKTEFNSLLPAGKIATEDLAQRDKFLMVLTFAAISPDLAPVWDQILAGAVVPSLDDVFARLLRVSSPIIATGSPSIDSLVLASQNNVRGEQGDRGGRGGRPNCNYCHRWSHTKKKCYKLHGKPTWAVNVVHADHTTPHSDRHTPSVTLNGTDYEDYLQYQANKQSSLSIASMAHSTNSVVCLTQSSSLGPWVLDFGASDHISGNPHLLSDFTNATSIPSVTFTNGSKAGVKAVGHAHPLPSLPLDSVLYILNCPFNVVSVSKPTRSLNCSITFDRTLLLYRTDARTDDWRRT